jgi:fumarate reductase subunit D
MASMSPCLNLLLGLLLGLGLIKALAGSVVVQA